MAIENKFCRVAVCTGERLKIFMPERHPVLLEYKSDSLKGGTQISVFKKNSLGVSPWQPQSRTKAPKQWFSNLNMHQTYLKGVIKC